MKIVRCIATFLLCCCLATFGFSQELKQFFYPDGHISSEGYFIDDKPDGFWKSYYQNGNLQSAGKRTHSQLDSIWCFYDKNGRIQKEISYFENHKNGFYKEYGVKDSTTYLKINVLYVNDLKQGIEQHFSANGQLMYEYNYVNGKKDGKAYEYDSNNVVITISLFENDKLLSSESINRTDNQGLKTGLHIDFYPNGAVKTEANYNKGKLNGLYKMYNQHEQLVQIGNYEGDSLLYSNATMAEFEDPFEKKEFYNDSIVKSRGMFRDNTPIGTHRKYDRQGNVVEGKLFDSQGNLVGSGITLDNGNKSGSWTFFYPSGKKESEGMFNDGLQVGTWKFYYADGTLKQIGDYQQGMLNGTWRFYNEVGDLQMEEEYEQGYRQGLHVEYDDEEEIVLEGMYKNNQPQGIWRSKIGDLITTGQYEYGEKIGTWQSTYLSGNKAFKGNYQNGKACGRHVYFYKNGQIEHDEQWKQGKPVKCWNYYDEKETLKCTIYYKNGVENRVVTPSK